MGLYTSEKKGNDESGNGTEAKPFKTILQVSKYNSFFVLNRVKVVANKDFGLSRK